MILTVRGMGEPLCATYARSYLVHKILQVMPYGAWGSPELIKDVHEPLWDTFTVLKQQLASEVPAPPCSPTHWGLQPRVLEAATLCAGGCNPVHPACTPMRGPGVPQGHRLAQQPLALRVLHHARARAGVAHAVRR
jgi:hypothetical protein